MYEFMLKGFLGYRPAQAVMGNSECLAQLSAFKFTFQTHSHNICM